MTNIDLEERLRGALRETAEHAPKGASIPDQVVTPQPRRQPWRPVLAAAVTVAVIGLGWGLFSSVSDRSDTPSDPGSDTSAAEPGGSRPSETATPARGSRAVVDRVAARASSHESERGFADVAVDYQRSTVTIWWKGEPPPEVADLVGSQPGGVTVALRDARFDESDLAIAAKRLLRAPTKALDGAQVTAVENKPDLGGITVSVVRPWNGDAAALVHVADVPVTVRLVDEPVAPLDRS